MHTKWLFTSCILVLFACKNEPSIQATSSPTTLDLVAGTASKSYLLTRLTSRTTTGGPIVDAQNDLAKLTPCQLDNVYTFYRDTKLEVREGNSKCNTTSSDLLTTSNWLVDTTKILSFRTDLFPELQILGLTSTEINGVYYEGGRTYSFTLTNR